MSLDESSELNMFQCHHPPSCETILWKGVFTVHSDRCALGSVPGWHCWQEPPRPAHPSAHGSHRSPLLPGK